jgi:hypothetical protein
MTSGPATEKRRYWLSLAALAVVLPGTVALHSWESVTEWRKRYDRDPLTVAAGATQSYAGAQWQLTGLSRLPGGRADAVVVLAQFEVAVDTQFEAGNFCHVALTDANGRRWQPVFLGERIVRQMHPEAVDKPRCSTTQFETLAKGSRVKMAETFIVPDAANDLTLNVTMTGALPQYLVLR